MSKYQRKVNADGTENPKYIDLLSEDKAISGQKFCCLSFLSPEKILKDKNLFLFEKFLKHFDTDESVKKFSQFLNFISYKYDLDFAKIMTDFDEFFKSEKDLIKPYFTTKQKGSGLGLSIVSKIINDHNGSLKFFDKKNGATIQIILPLK